MERDQIYNAIRRVSQSERPRIEIIKRAAQQGRSLGVFASSFNPTTIAHVELMRRAAKTFSLDETLALAGQANADKQSYECSLEDRLEMLLLALVSEQQVSIGISSHAFFVDMMDAMASANHCDADLRFIVGFDTFERVLDTQERYTARYHRKFRDRIEALEYLFARCGFIVAARAGAGLDEVRMLVESEPLIPQDRVFYLDFPSDLGELSATDVRARRQTGTPISGLVPASVEQYIIEHRLYVAESSTSDFSQGN